ncbi:MAG: hypothetical protein WC333_09900 [Dehalococcoidia bacterium]
MAVEGKQPGVLQRLLQIRIKGAGQLAAAGGAGVYALDMGDAGGIFG